MKADRSDLKPIERPELERFGNVSPALANFSETAMDFVQVPSAALITGGAKLALLQMSYSAYRHTPRHRYGYQDLPHQRWFPRFPSDRGPPVLFVGGTTPNQKYACHQPLKDLYR